MIFSFHDRTPLSLTITTRAGLRPRIALGSGLLIPSPCRRIILRHTPPVGIQVPELSLCPCIALSRGFLVPSPCHHVVLWYSSPVGKHLPKLVLRPPVPLSRSFLVPSLRHHIILRHTSPPAIIQLSKLVLR